MSGKLFIGEKNWIGKEYILDTEILIFEGKYWNDKKILMEKNMMNIKT